MKFSVISRSRISGSPISSSSDASAAVSAPLLSGARSSGSGQLPRRRRLGWRLLGGLCWLTVALGACIIDEHKYSQQADDCWRYCDSLESYCTGFSRVYENRETCLATCSLMDYDAGDVPLTTANTLSCRLDKVGDRRIESNECPLVGPGGRCL